MPNSRFTTAERVRENRLRRVADRRGLALARSRRRDPGADDYGLYSLTEKASGEVVVQGLPLEAVERLLAAVVRREHTLTAEQMEVVLEALSGRLQAADPAAIRSLAGQRVVDPAVGRTAFS